MQNRLIEWFQSQKRDLPWRNEPTPYAVWVSEVMLQQTQVAVVIPYFERWMNQFPTIESLAQAPLDAVIKAWEGLGYYSRARNLHAGARQVVAEFGGQLPAAPELLRKIKGLGPYTVGAIAGFAFRQKAAAVDGNVIRVLARYFHLNDDFSKAANVKKIWRLAEQILPEDQPWVFSEALIELGAMVCTKKPKCHLCPLKSGCQSYIQGDAHELPFKSAKLQTQKLFRAVALIVTQEGKWLIKRVDSGKVMSDLHEFPYFETSEEGIKPDDLQRLIRDELGLEAVYQGQLPAEQHSFTRYLVSLFPFCFVCKNPKAVADYQWLLPVELSRLAFSSGHRRLLTRLPDGNWPHKV